MANPLLDDRLVQLLLEDVLDADSLTALPYFEDHGRETFALYLGACRRLGREVLFPTLRPMDEEPPVFEHGRVTLHPSFREAFGHVRELGVISATRPGQVGGQQLPLTVATLAHAYLMAGNLGVVGLAWLTTGAAHLIEAFGADEVKARFLQKMYAGQWTGTMALTEPQAGSSLADITTSAWAPGAGTKPQRGAQMLNRRAAHHRAGYVGNQVVARHDGAP
ncbi:MAG: acyl-CoA dehydrogenase family protein, partial [Myxococcota bacterium]